MSRVLTSLLGGLLLSLALSTSPAQAALQVTGKPKVSFYAKGSPGALDIEGKTNAFVIKDDGTTVTCTVALADVSTGIDMRDEHMRDEFMEVGTFPDASLSFNRADLKLPTNVGDAAQGTIQATFTAHGLPHAATVSYTIKKGKSAYSVDATFNYNASDHGIKIPSYLGVTVDPSQSARVRFDMVDI